MKLTEFNPGSGCGCKLGPEALQCILGASGVRSNDFWPQLWVGHEHADDIFQDTVLVAWRRLGDYDRTRLRLPPP